MTCTARERKNPRVRLPNAALASGLIASCTNLGEDERNDYAIAPMPLRVCLVAERWGMPE